MNAATTSRPRPEFDTDQWVISGESCDHRLVVGVEQRPNTGVPRANSTGAITCVFSWNNGKRKRPRINHYRETAYDSLEQHPPIPEEHVPVPRPPSTTYSVRQIVIDRGDDPSEQERTVH